MNHSKPILWLLLILMVVITCQSSLVAAKPLRTDLDFVGADLRDVFRALAAQFHVDIFVGEEVQDKVTLHLSNVTLQEALDILQNTYKLKIESTNNIYHVNKFYDERCDIQYKDGLLSVEANEIPLNVLLNKIQTECQVNLVFPATTNRITITLYRLPLINSLETIASAAGFAVEQNGQVYTFHPAVETNGSKLMVRFENNLLSLDAQNAPLSTVAKEITRRTEISVIPENNLQANITVFFNDLPVTDGLRALVSANGLRLVEENPSLFRISKGNGGGIRVKYENSLLSIDATGSEISQILDEVARSAKVNIILDDDVRGSVTVRFDNLPLATGLSNMLEANGYNLELREGAYLVHKKNAQQGVRITYDPGTLKFNIEITNNTTLASVLATLAQKAGINLVVYSNANAPLNNIFLHNVSLERAFDMLLRGTSLIYKKQGDTLLVGDGANLRIDNDLLENRIFYLNYIQADSFLNMLPPNFPRQYFIVLKDQGALCVSGSPEFLDQVEAYIKDLDQPKNQIHTEVVPIRNMKAEDILKLVPSSIPKTDLMVVKEGNSIAVTGTSAYIDQVKGYLSQVDILNPLILFDVMVIQVNNDDSREGGLQSILKMQRGDRNQTTYDTDNGLISQVIDPNSKIIEHFTAMLKAAITQKKAKVWANPQLTALSGSPANFKVTTKDQIALPYQSGTGDNAQTLYNIINIETGIEISITPWVSANQDITLEIKPHINQVIPSDTSSSTGSSTSTTPIAKTDERSVDTSIRVRDRSTIVIAGLRQKITSRETNKIPILGYIPFIGKIFQYNSKIENDSEFIIVITPRLLSGQEAVDKSNVETIQKYSNAVKEDHPIGKLKDEDDSDQTKKAEGTKK